LFGDVIDMKQSKLWIVSLGTALAAASAAGACGGGDGERAGQGGRHESGSGDGEGGVTGGGLDIDAGNGLALVIEPQHPVLDVTGAPQSLPLTVKLNTGEVPTAVNWSLDDVVVGTIAPDGVFTSPGFVAGKAKVTAQIGSLEATTTVTVRVQIVDNAGMIAPGDQTLLEGGGSADAAFRWLYPYDKTIFPRGLGAPSLQFGGDAADAMYIHVSVGDFHYKGFFGASNPSRVALPEAVWKGVTMSAAAGDTVKVEATKLSSGGVSGPVHEGWTIAPGSLKGVVYYNTYVSKLAQSGAVMRIRLGKDAEVFMDGCTVCHSVSARGNVLAAGVDWTMAPRTRRAARASISRLMGRRVFDWPTRMDVSSRSPRSRPMARGCCPTVYRRTAHRCGGSRVIRLHGSSTRRAGNRSRHRV